MAGLVGLSPVMVQSKSISTWDFFRVTCPYHIKGYQLETIGRANFEYDWRLETATLVAGQRPIRESRLAN